MGLNPVSNYLSLDLIKVATKAFDVNGNNRVDKNEAGGSHRAIREASRDKDGYANDIVGTSELANAVKQGRVQLQYMPVAVADAVANALSGGDAWVSKEDFTFSETGRAKLDTNDDNRISRKEVSEALQDGRLVIGKTFEMNTGYWD